jgi:hypothetical protein
MPDRLMSARFHTGMRTKTAGVVFCVFLFSLGMIDKGRPKSDPDQVYYDIERFYRFKDLPGIHSRFSWYMPLVAQMEQTRAKAFGVQRLRVTVLDSPAGLASAVSTTRK